MNLEIKQQIEDISSTVQSLYGGLKDELKQKFDGLQRQVDAVEVKLGAPAYSSVPGIEWKGPGRQGHARARRPASQKWPNPNRHRQPLGGVESQNVG